MKIAKSLTTLILSIAYICTFGALSFSVSFPDDTDVTFDGWLI